MIDISDNIFISKPWKQLYGFEIFPTNKTSSKEYWNCYIIKNNKKYYFTAKKREIIKGIVSKYRIENSIFLEDLHKQHCGDSLKIIRKIEGNTNEFEAEFQKYPCKIISKKGLILKGEVLNPKIEQVEFVEKLWLQNCGDSIKIVSKITEGENKGKWKGVFVKQPFEIVSSKKNIVSGNVYNPQIEKTNFIEKIWEQNCGDGLKILSKSTKKGSDGSFLWEVEFLNKPYKTLATKSNIINGKVENKNVIWYSENRLKKYIVDSFANSKPSLKELASSLNISYTHVSRLIKKFSLTNLVKLGDYKQRKLIDIIKKYISEKEIKENIFFSDIKQEIDIYLPNLKIGIEFNGNWWHCDFYKDSLYHQKKTLAFEQKGIKLVHIWEWEFDLNPKKVEEYIKNNLLNIQPHFEIKECLFTEINKGKELKIEVFYKNIFLKNFVFIKETKDLWRVEFQEKHEIIDKYVSNKFIQKYNPAKIEFCCDFDKYAKKDFSCLNFNFLSLSPPNFKLFDNKFKKILNDNLNIKAETNNVFKIYDCGKLNLIWENNGQKTK